MGDLRRTLENASVLLVVFLSAPLAALLVAVFAIYLVILFAPTVAGGAADLRDLFALIYVAVYLAICFVAVKGG